MGIAYCWVIPQLAFLLEMKKAEKGAGPAGSDQNTVANGRVLQLQEIYGTENEYIEAFKVNEDKIDDTDFEVEKREEYIIDNDNEYIEAYKDDEEGVDSISFGERSSKMGLLAQTETKIKLQNETIVYTDIPLDEHTTDGGGEGQITNFFSREWEAFKHEKETKLGDKQKISTVLNFDELKKEWSSEDNENHWSKRKVKKQSV